MRRARYLWCVALFLSGVLSFPQYDSNYVPEPRAGIGAAPAVLWREPTDIRKRDLFYGPGGPGHAPAGEFFFEAENHHGTQPKFIVRDQNNILWGVKLGPEARVETTATRLLWAAGYFTDEEYFLTELVITGVPPDAMRGHISDEGRAFAVRMKRHNKHEHKIGHWDWTTNPFAGTRELNGLKVMMELMNNTDLKLEHRVIYDIEGKEQRYYIKDPGASFGRAGAGYFTHSKGVLRDFEHFDLIKHDHGDHLDFWYFKHIPRADAKWIGEIMGQLSDKQIADAFRAGGFSPEEVEGFTRKLREKINELRAL